jgi:hypothetical protein
MTTPTTPAHCRKGLEETANISAVGAEALERINRQLAEIARQIREINPRRHLRLHALRQKSSQEGGTQDMRDFLASMRGQKRQPTSALRLRLNPCGAAHCSGCPHPKWGVWRLYRDHKTGQERQGMSDVSTLAQAYAFARHAPDAARTVELVKRAQALIEQRASLISAFSRLGKVARASLAKTHEPELV